MELNPAPVPVVQHPGERFDSVKSNPAEVSNKGQPQSGKERRKERLPGRRAAAYSVYKPADCCELPRSAQGGGYSLTIAPPSMHRSIAIAADMQSGHAG
ncbi:unnamed protein product [Sphagnum tenellum]